MLAGRGKKFTRKIPNYTPNSKGKKGRSTEKVKGQDLMADEIVDNEVHLKTQMIEPSPVHLPGTARAATQEGDVILEIEVGESEDEFLNEEREESMIIGKGKRNELNSPGRPAKRLRVHQEINRSRQLDQDSQKPQTETSTDQAGSNNNAAVMQNDQGGLGQQSGDEQRLIQRITDNEQFMQGFARFMEQNGYIYRSQQCQSTSTVQDKGSNELKNSAEADSLVTEVARQPPINKQRIGNDPVARPEQGLLSRSNNHNIVPLDNNSSGLTIYKPAIRMVSQLR